MEPQDEQDETILEKYGLYMGIVCGLLLVCTGLVAFSIMWPGAQVSTASLDTSARFTPRN